MSVEMQGTHYVPTNNNGLQLGGKYQSLLDANPYRNQRYKKTPWQNFLTSLGIRTQADAWQENMSVQAAEYDAAIAQKQYDEQYNEPAEQVARMRAAGLNPDINGGQSIDSGSAAPLGEDPSTPMETTADDVSGIFAIATQVANSALGAFSTALGVVQSIQGVQGKNLQNTLGSLTNESDMLNFVIKAAPMLLPNSPDLTSGDGDDLIANSYDWHSEALKNAERFAGKLPRKLRRKFLDTIEQYWSSGPGESESYDEWKKRIQNRRSFYTERGTFYSDIDDVLQLITDPISEMAEKIFKQSQKTELKQGEAAEEAAKTEKAYQSTLDGSLIAESENTAARRSKTNDEMVDTLNGTIGDIMKGLKSASEDGGIKGALAHIALVLMASVRLWLANQSTSFSRSSGSSSSVSKSGMSNSSSSSFSLGF